VSSGRGVKLTEIKNAWSYTSIPSYAPLTWYSVKKKHTDNFTFYVWNMNVPSNEMEGGCFY